MHVMIRKEMSIKVSRKQAGDLHLTYFLLNNQTSVLTEIISDDSFMSEIKLTVR